MDDLYSVGSSVPDRPPQPTGPPKTAALAGTSTPAREVTAVVSPPPARLPGAIQPGAIAKSSAGGSPVPARVLQEKVPASSDPNEATRQTIVKMCEYIRAGKDDDLVKWWAECGVTRYGMGNRDPQALCWAMYWLVKHAIAFARDEPRLFQVGEPDGLDMLIAPAVLIRMSQPKEDCDGFTMLICALLAYLGVNCVIVTVAADPSDPSRWSHVFPMAVMPSGNTCPLDASHGNHPGWMVPREHIFRWQAWSLAGEPVNTPMPSKHRQGLHGYMPRGRRMRTTRGMGQGCLDENGNPVDCSTLAGDYGGSPAPVVTTPIMTGSQPCINQYGEIISCGSSLPGSMLLASSPPPCYDQNGNSIVCGSAAPGSTINSATGVSISTPAGSSPSTIASIINSAINGAAKDAQLALLPAGSYISPSGAVSVGGALASLGSLGSLLPILLIGLVVVMVVSHEEG